jgi:RNA polymerase-binding transcription factor DksA
MQEPKAQELETGGDNTPLSEGADSVQVHEQERARSELLGRLIERAAKLERALRDLQAGVYGLCNLCRNPIHRERLEAIPEAAFCLDCKTRLEAGVTARRLEHLPS